MLRKLLVLLLMELCTVLYARGGQQPVRNYDGSDVQPSAAQNPHPAVEVIVAPKPDEKAISGRKSSYSISVSSSEWIDTGIPLTPGDRLEITATGTVQLEDGRSATAAGASRGWKDLLRQFTDHSSGPGALIGRVGTAESVPFLVGEQKALDLTQSGHLFLAINGADGVQPTGKYSVKIKLSRPQAAKATANSQTAVALPELNTLLSPQIFANIPRRVGDQQGNPGDMVNFALIGSEEQVKSAFKAAGWVTVDKSTEDAILHGLLATLSHESYVEMPMSTLYLFGRPQDMSFARADPLKVAAVRHHLRVWNSGQTLSGKPLWVGSATYDNGFERDRRNGGVTHHIDPEIDQERDFIQKSFAAAGVVASAAYVLPENPLQTAKTATGGSFHSDGRIVVLLLR